jgi:hypothetical protein
MPVTARAYLSPTLVLLAFDYPEGKTDKTFLGFAIKREPGFDGAQFTYLPNRIGFDGPNRDGSSEGSDQWPIQKFYWWDARINTLDRGKQFTYTISVVNGTPTHPAIGAAPNLAATLPVTIPHEVEHGIGTHFNRRGEFSGFCHRVRPQPDRREIARGLHVAWQWYGEGCGGFPEASGEGWMQH